MQSNRKFAAVTRVGLDLTKKDFQVHAVHARGEVVAARKLRWRQLNTWIHFMKPNPAVGTPRIMSSNDKDWLIGFRKRIADAGVPEIVAAITSALANSGKQSARRYR